MPYDPWVSVGQVVGWQIERLFPGQRVDVDIRAQPGNTLEQALQPLADLKCRPDAIILFSGHNELQARCGWSRSAPHYAEEGPVTLLGFEEAARSISATMNLILATLDRYYGEIPPPSNVTRSLVNHPCCTLREYAVLRRDFHLRLESLAAFCNQIGALAILIKPGSNDGAFEPSRSVLSSSTRPAARAAFEKAFRAARAAETSDAQVAIAAYRRLSGEQPEFAECHYRLARLLEQQGAYAEAKQHFILARDQDGLPMRCPSDFREFFEVVSRRFGALLIDGPAILAPFCPHGILDDHVYHDADHLNLAGTVALAHDILEKLRTRRAFGWPESIRVPRIELEDCARHFELNTETWVKVCERSANFYSRLAYLRFDPTDRLAVQDRYMRAARAIAAGQSAETLSLIPSLAPMLGLLNGPGQDRPDGSVDRSSEASGPER